MPYHHAGEFSLQNVPGHFGVEHGHVTAPAIDVVLDAHDLIGGHLPEDLAMVHRPGPFLERQELSSAVQSVLHRLCHVGNIGWVINYLVLAVINRLELFSQPS